MTHGAIFYEVRSVGHKSNGRLEQLFVRPSMAVLNAAADGSLFPAPRDRLGGAPIGRERDLRRRPLATAFRLRGPRHAEPAGCSPSARGVAPGVTSTAHRGRRVRMR